MPSRLSVYPYVCYKLAKNSIAQKLHVLGMFWVIFLNQSDNYRISTLGVQKNSKIFSLTESIPIKTGTPPILNIILNTKVKKLVSLIEKTIVIQYIQYNRTFCSL